MQITNMNLLAYILRSDTRHVFSAFALKTSREQGSAVAECRISLKKNSAKLGNQNIAREGDSLVVLTARQRVGGES